MFIVSPRIGLCNQLQCIVKGILLGIKYNRNIYINKFQINLYSNDLCDINEILNINKINSYLLSKNIYNCKIISQVDPVIIDNLENYKLCKINYDSISSETFINNHIDENLDKSILYLGNLVSLCISQSFEYNWGDYTNLYYNLMSNIIFHDKFYELKENIKNKLELVNYNTVHLRIEDDALKHFSHCYNLSIEEYNANILSFYEEKMKHCTNRTYICSGMLKYDNTINFAYYEKMMRDNSLLCDKKDIVIDSYYLDNRELIAIIELLLAYDADKFIGCGISSFSRCIENYFICNKNNTNIFLF
jgi:hypothetical protein